MRVAVIADLSGRGRPEEALDHVASLTAQRVDVDAWDEMVARLGPAIDVDLPFAARVHLEALEDLHPDGLVRGQPALANLLRARAAVGDPEAMAQHLAAAGATGVTEAPREGPGAAPSEPAAATPAPSADPKPAPGADDLLDEILGEGAGHVAASDRPADAWDRAIQDIIDASVDTTDHAGQDRLRGLIDAELARRVSAITSHPRFERVEAAWRGLLALTDAADEHEVELFAFDLPLDVLASEVAACGGKIEETVLFRLAVAQLRDVYGGEAVSLFVVAHDVEADDAATLVPLLASLAAAAGAPVLAGAAPSLAGEGPEGVQPPGIADWSALCRSSARVGLVYPRLLLRPSWDAADEPVTHVKFGEAGGDTGGGAPLFGCGALALAVAALRAVDVGSGLSDAPRFARLGDLPIQALETATGFEQVGPTERLLTEREILALRDAGFVPLAGLVRTDEAELLSFRALDGGRLFGAAGGA